MNVRTLLQFLDALSEPVQSVGGDPKLGGVRTALQPFADLPIAEFASFLQAAENYRREGTVAIPNPAFESVARATQSLAQSLAQASDGDDLGPAEKAWADALAALGAGFGIKVTAKADAKLQAKIRLDRKLATIEQDIRTLAARVLAPEDYADSDIVAAFSTVRSLLDAAGWKALAQRFGVTLRAKADPLTMIVIHLSGIPLPAPVKPSKSKAAPDPETIRAHAARLRELSEFSVDPERLSLAQIDAELATFEKLTEPTLKSVVEESRLAISGKKKKDLLAAIRRHLDASHRAKAEVAV
ncbi:MAG: hypothetical protein K2X38_12140 [Gemmataceae bacterium]|nr:hypothetical protein [Gemmataceae bacterium]